jgi:hypothetical protein
MNRAAWLPDAAPAVQLYPASKWSGAVGPRRYDRSQGLEPTGTGGRAALAGDGETGRVFTDATGDLGLAAGAFEGEAGAMGFAAVTARGWTALDSAAGRGLVAGTVATAAGAAGLAVAPAGAWELTAATAGFGIVAGVTGLPPVVTGGAPAGRVAGAAAFEPGALR